MYSFENIVRYSELNYEGRLPLEKILDYFQDCSSLHSESLGVGIDFLRGKKRAWVLSSWQVEINKYPLYKEKIKIATWPYSFNSIFGYRNFIINNEQGEVLAQANSVWVLLDLNKMRPTKVLPEMASAYELKPGLAMTLNENRIELRGPMQPQKQFEIKKYHIDINQHVNNAKYIMFAEEYLPSGFYTTQLRAEYRKAAVLGDIIYPYIEENESKVTVMLADKEKRPYAVIELGRGK